MSRIARVEDDDSLSASKEDEEEKREEEDLEQERGQHQHQQHMLNYDDDDDDDDDENDEALQEIDALEEHLRTKRSTSTYRAGSIIAHATSTFEAPSRNRVQPYRPTQSSSEAQLMMMTIVPNEPGAFEINGPPPPLLQVHQPHTAQIQRDEEPALSSNHTRVQTCSVSAVDSAAGANGGENGPERYLPPLFINSNRRNKYLLPAFGLLAIVGVVVGCVVGIGRRNDRNHDIEKSGPGEVVFVRPVSPESQCLLGGNQVESDRYDKLLSTIVSEQPDMEMRLRDPESNARKALCWLVHVDALKIETTLGEEYRMIQRFTLALIYYHFVREDREGQKNYLLQSNWLMAVHECDWDFLECRVTAGDVVTGAYLSTKRMAGIIPSELALLTRLEILELRSNSLTGWIPTELWTMTQLKVLALSLNSLTGEFPTELPNLTSLTALELGSDFLTGTLPDMSALTNLELISLSHNPYIGGPIPNMAAWSNLAVINLSDLGLTGTIPTYIESLSNLKLLTIATTLMTGTLLTELGGLLNLEALALNNGFFGGTVPSEIGNLTALRRLDFRDMRSLTGAIPSELGKLVDLEMLGLGGGSVFSGTMPTEVCALRNKSLARLTAVCYGSTLVCNCCTGCL